MKWTIYIFERGTIVLLLHDGQSRASSTVVDDSPRASFLFHADRRGQEGEKMYDYEAKCNYLDGVKSVFIGL